MNSDLSVTWPAGRCLILNDLYNICDLALFNEAFELDHCHCSIAARL